MNIVSANATIGKAQGLFSSVRTSLNMVKSLRFSAGRRILLAGSAMLLVAACESNPEPGGVFAPVDGFAGLIAGDEPRAVVVGRDVLGNGGTVADAAVAMYFTMAVTMPSRAGIGGGGVCVYFDAPNLSSEVFEFLPRQSASGGMVPGNVRGMAALHARYGTLRWAQMLSPAEGYARFGHAVSRAFARDLAVAGQALQQVPDLRRRFEMPDGALAREGNTIAQTELSAVLAGVRQRGAAYFYGGDFANRLAEASTRAGLPLTVEDIRSSLPSIRPAASFPVNSDVAYFSTPPAAGGIVAAQIWQMLTAAEDYEDASEEQRSHLFAEASMRAFSQRTGWIMPDGRSKEDLETLLSEARAETVMANFNSGRHTPADQLSPVPGTAPGDPGAAGFVIGDAYGNGVSCSFTMNGLFGSGRVAPGTGVLLPAPRRALSDGGDTLSAVIVANTNTGVLRFLGSSSGGAAASTSLVRLMLDSLATDKGLSASMAEPRVHHGGAPDITFYEEGSGAVADLEAKGHVTQIVPQIGQANAIYCPRGIVQSPAACEVQADPRGHGLSSLVQ
ncbi:gamma-glutamyltransferase [Denitrobaculum tricleocarpae]|uniref:gamma-glutamyltransferase n=1 Tax=Denitrobaculum tricleocarpae TaxID=2591009 RepID=UPI0015D30976|nr:gamma-glutamyltransferase [Denitrobaculum tricleocarpae]